MTFANSLKIFAQREVSFVRNVKAFQEEKCLNRKPVCSQLNENNINQLYNQDLHTTLRFCTQKVTFKDVDSEENHNPTLKKPILCDIYVQL